MKKLILLSLLLTSLVGKSQLIGFTKDQVVTYLKGAINIYEIEYNTSENGTTYVTCKDKTSDAVLLGYFFNSNDVCYKTAEVYTYSLLSTVINGFNKNQNRISEDTWTNYTNKDFTIIYKLTKQDKLFTITTHIEK